MSLETKKRWCHRLNRSPQIKHDVLFWSSPSTEAYRDLQRWLFTCLMCWMLRDKLIILEYISRQLYTAVKISNVLALSHKSLFSRTLGQMSSLKKNFLCFSRACTYLNAQHFFLEKQQLKITNIVHQFCNIPTQFFFPSWSHSLPVEL